MCLQPPRRSISPLLRRPYAHHRVLRRKLSATQPRTGASLERYVMSQSQAASAFTPIARRIRRQLSGWLRWCSPNRAGLRAVQSPIELLRGTPARRGCREVLDGPASETLHNNPSQFQTRARFQGTTALLLQRNFGTKALPCGDANCPVPDSRAVKCSQDWCLAHPRVFHPPTFRRECWRHPVAKQVLPEERNPGPLPPHRTCSCPQRYLR